MTDKPKIFVTLDTVVLAETPTPRVLLIKRKYPPFEGCWALPGGHLEPGEDLDEGAYRELKEETGLECPNLLQIAAVGTPGRDPRGHAVSIIYATIVESELKTQAGDDAAEAKWFDIQALPEMAFDHKDFVEMACNTML